MLIDGILGLIVIKAFFILLRLITQFIIKLDYITTINSLFQIEILQRRNKMMTTYSLLPNSSKYSGIFEMILMKEFISRNCITTMIQRA